MLRKACWFIIALMVSLAAGSRTGQAQDRAMASAPAFSGGIFVTPVPAAPFSARAVQEMTQVLKDGSSFQRKTAGLIARDSLGRICNEAREVLPANSKEEPALLSIHVYDPTSNVSTLLNPQTKIARQLTLPNPPAKEPPSNWANTGTPVKWRSNVVEEDLGTNVIEGLDVHGYRRTRTLSEADSGTGRQVKIVDEYWYSDSLHINMVQRHSDPRTGSLQITVTHVDRTEPLVDLFLVPPDYKVVDMTPNQAEALR